jgi:pyruvate, water dikinase
MEPILQKSLLKLAERAKELECLYKVEEAINNSEGSEKVFFKELIRIIPAGMQFSTICEVKIEYNSVSYQSEDFQDSEWRIKSDLLINKKYAGFIQVVYTQMIKSDSENQFLPEEEKLLETIASRISCWLHLLSLTGRGQDMQIKK